MRPAFTRDYRAEDWFDLAMRFFLCLMALMLPYSMAVIEWTFGLSFVAYVAKRIYLFSKGSCSPWWTMFRPRPNPLNWPVVVYLAACFVSVFMSDRFGDSFESLFTKTAEPIVLYFLVLEAFRTAKQIRVLLMVILMTAVVTGVDALVQFHITGEDFFFGRPLSKGPRATAGFNAPTGLGAYLVMTIPVVAGLWNTPPWKSTTAKAVLTGSLVCLIYALVLTFSRGAWLSLILGGLLGAVGYMIMRRVNRRQILAVSIGSILLLGLMGSYYVANKDRFSSLNRSVLNWRVAVWRDTVEMIKEKPVFGYGINTYMRQFQYYRYDRLNVPKHKQHGATYAHNCYLQIAMESGLLGLAAFAWILIAYYRSVIGKIRGLIEEQGENALLAVGLLTGISAFFIHAFFDTHFYSLPLAAYLWSMLAALYIVLNPLSNGRTASHA